MAPIIRIERLGKTYAAGTVALDDVSLDIEEGEILALLGPNGAGKTTLISAVCGLVQPTTGRITVGGHDIARDYRRARALIGLVPQEVLIEPFEKVGANVAYTRGLFGKPRDDAHIEKVLRSLALWDKRDAKTMELSGGMKRRVLIAKALSHEPQVLFLDEPSAGVDVELRREMWALVRQLARRGHHHRPDHALHRRGRGDGRPRRHHQQGPAAAGRGQGPADEPLRPQDPDHRADPAAGDLPERLCRDGLAPGRATAGRWSTNTTPAPNARASPG